MTSQRKSVAAPLRVEVELRGGKVCAWVPPANHPEGEQILYDLDPAYLSSLIQGLRHIQASLNGGRG